MGLNAIKKCLILKLRKFISQFRISKKSKKIKKPPITILESNNRTHVQIEALDATCTKTIEVLKKNETEDIELGINKFDIVAGFGDVLPEYWTDLAYPPVSPEQIKKEIKYYRYHTYRVVFH